MNNEEKTDSPKPDAILSTGAESELDSTKLPGAIPEDINPAAPIVAEKLQSAEVIKRPADADGSPSSSVEPAPRLDTPTPPIAVEPVFVEKRRSFFEEQHLPVIEMAPAVSNPARDADVRNWRGGGCSWRWFCFATKYTQSPGCAPRHEFAWKGVVAPQSSSYRR
jgi:hypothetical protein